MMYSNIGLTCRETLPLILIRHSFQCHLTLQSVICLALVRRFTVKRVFMDDFCVIHRKINSRPKLDVKNNIIGSVQLNLRSIWLYIIRKLSLRPVIAGHGILILLKGHKRRSSVSKAGICFIVWAMN